MNIIKNNFSQSYLVELTLIIAMLLTGGFSEVFSCIIGVVTSIALTLKIVQNKCFRFSLNVTSISFLVILGGYLLSCFYAVDSGMAVLGFVKFLPVVLFMLLLMQNKQDKLNTLEILPYVGLGLGIISLALMFFPESVFAVEGRLAGFFQYPNTFSMFLLICQLLVISEKELKLRNIIIAVALFALIILTMSRAVFVLAILSNVVLLFLTKGKKVRITLSVIIIALVTIVAIFYSSIKEHEFFGRFLSISVFESTFAGRLLYWRDSIETILKHPFGLGYMGYYYIEQSIQTGVYSIKYIHNDVLQLLLDIGWIPAVAFLLTFTKAIFSKTTKASYKVILVTFFMHIIFDFDLQFTAMMFVLLLFLELESEREYIIDKKKNVIIGANAILCIISLFFSITLLFDHFSNYKVADSLYPFNTQTKINLMIEKKDIKQQDKIADDIIAQNEFVPVAYSAKARYAYSNGDFSGLIKYKEKIFDIAPYAYEEYEEFAYMLIYGIDAYSQIGDIESADVCKNELIKLEKKLNSLEERTSYLGKIIVDKPTTQFPQDISNYIDSLEAINE